MWEKNIKLVNKAYFVSGYWLLRIWSGCRAMNSVPQIYSGDLAQTVTVSWISPSEPSTIYICIRLRFGLVNVINDYQRLEIYVISVGNFYPLMLINWICHTKSESDSFLYTRNI